MKLNKLFNIGKKPEPQPEQPPVILRAQQVAPGVYRLPEGEGVAKRILVDAVPPAEAEQERYPGLSSPSVEQKTAATYPYYGWVRGLLDAPQKDDCYIVIFLDAIHFRVVGYIDRYGRVFAAAAPLTIPPAEYPAVMFARYLDQAEEGKDYGCVELYSPSGQVTYPAEYVQCQDRFTLFGSWFDFSVTGQELCLDDALARAFLAFVLRPKLLGVGVPHRDLSVVEQVLSQNHNPLSGMLQVASIMEAAAADPAQTPPGLGRCLAHWLREAGITEAQATVGEGRSSGLNLLLNTKFSDMVYLSQDADCPLSNRTVWKLEGALNRYRLIKENLGEDAATATMRDCNLQVQRLFVDMVDQAPDVEKAYDATWSHRALEWDVRSGIARGMEQLRIPLRFEVSFRLDYQAGCVYFDIMVPDGDMMPVMVWRDDVASMVVLRNIYMLDSARLDNSVDVTSGWVKRSDDDRCQDAKDYAARLGMLLAALAFRQSASISEVMIQARFFSEDPEAHPGKRVYKRSLKRRFFKDRETWVASAKTHPFALFACEDDWDVNAVFSDVSWSYSSLLRDGKAQSDQLFESLAMLDAWEQPQPFSTSSVKALCAQDKTEMEINYRSGFAQVADKAAKCLLDCSEEECFRLLRQMQDKTNDPQVFAACNRVMAQLAEGTLDVGNENKLVEAFVGSDRFVEAMDKVASLRVGAFLAPQVTPEGAQALRQVDKEALAILRQVVDEAQAAGVFQDSEDTVYRVFDSTTSRVLYNNVRAGVLRVAGLDLSNDRGKRVRLAADGYYYCCLMMLNLMEQDFDFHEDALLLGKRCITMAPTMASGYRQLARAYMLVGDMASARDILITALRWVVMPSDISLMYYQLAYVEWKSGRPQVAMACYLKSIAESADLRDQATSELRELVGEERLALMAAEDVSLTLAEAGIPLAPKEDVLSLLRRASRATVNEGLVPESKNLLSVQLQHKHDDVLAHVLQSLG